MGNNNSRESYVPSQTQPVNWETVSYLQFKRRRTKKDFHLDAIEYALDRTLQAPVRKATAEKLGEDLFRDGKRIVASTQGLSGANLVNKRTYFALEPVTDVQPEVHDKSLLVAIETVKAAFQQISFKEAFALYMRTMGIHSVTDCKLLLGVTVRQYRNLCNHGRKKLRAYPGFNEAYFLLYIHSDEADIRAFFTFLIKQMSNYQLS